MFIYFKICSHKLHSILTYLFYNFNIVKFKKYFYSFVYRLLEWGDKNGIIRLLKEN